MRLDRHFHQAAISEFHILGFMITARGCLFETIRRHHHWQPPRDNHLLSRRVEKFELSRSLLNRQREARGTEFSETELRCPVHAVDLKIKIEGRTAPVPFSVECLKKVRFFQIPDNQSVQRQIDQPFRLLQKKVLCFCPENLRQEQIHALACVSYAADRRLPLIRRNTVCAEGDCGNLFHLGNRLYLLPAVTAHMEFRRCLSCIRYADRSVFAVCLYRANSLCVAYRIPQKGRIDLCGNCFDSLSAQLIQLFHRKEKALFD